MGGFERVEGWLDLAPPFQGWKRRETSTTPRLLHPTSNVYYRQVSNAGINKAKPTGTQHSAAITETWEKNQPAGA